MIITKSVAYHGFKHILIVNGHGSNAILCDTAARKTTLATESVCGALNYFALADKAFKQVQETPTVAHADEFETSLYLYVAADRVRMDRAVSGDDVTGKYVSSDSTSENPVRFSDYWGRWTQKGVHGDPTRATAEKGKVIYEAAVSGLVEVIREWRSWPVEKRSDQHTHPVQSQIRW